MNDERSEQASTTPQVEVTSQCGPGCNCGTTGLRTKGKVIVCLVVAVAAAVVLARGLGEADIFLLSKGLTEAIGAFSLDNI